MMKRYSVRRTRGPRSWNGLDMARELYQARAEREFACGALASSSDRELYRVRAEREGRAGGISYGATLARGNVQGSCMLQAAFAQCAGIRARRCGKVERKGCSTERSRRASL